MADRRITDYIQRQRKTYTKDAIREMLLRRGYDAAAVEEGFHAVEAGEAPPEARLTARGWLIYAAYIAALYLLIVAAGVIFAGLQVVQALWVVGIFLVLALPGAALFAAMSRSLALGLAGGIVIAALIPFIVIVILGGSCVALLAALQPPRTTGGTVTISLEPPLAFDGTSEATCQYSTDGANLSVFANSIGPIDGELLGVSISHGAGAAGYTSVSVNLTPPTFEGGRFFFADETTGLQATSTPDLSSGTVEFSELRSESVEGPRGTGGPDAVEAISGSISWQCPLP